MVFTSAFKENGQNFFVNLLCEFKVKTYLKCGTNDFFDLALLAFFCRFWRLCRDYTLGQFLNRQFFNNLFYWHFLCIVTPYVLKVSWKFCNILLCIWKCIICAFVSLQIWYTVRSKTCSDQVIWTTKIQCHSIQVVIL